MEAEENTLRPFIENLQISDPCVMLDTSATDLPDGRNRGKANHKFEELATMARMVTFRHCFCDVYEGDHISVETKKTVVHESGGVAISYTWGAFDRQYHCIGHKYGKPLERARPICLGAEWSVGSFTKRLVQLSDVYGACWIDQFCAPQSEEKIAKTLAKIPLIYRTLEVVVILPGPICGCLRKVYESYRATTTAATHVSASADQIANGNLKELQSTLMGGLCVNSNGNCSWLRRLWPLQEFRYARTISVIFADQEVAQCSAPIGGKLARYLQKMCEEATGQCGSPEDILSTVIPDNVMFYENLSKVISQGYRSNASLASPSVTYICEEQARLLLGEKLKQPMSRSNTKDLDGSIYDLLATIQTFVSMNSVASEDRDYVVSVWVDWAEYQIPENFRNLSWEALLADAFSQLRRRFPLFVPSRCPAGLLGSSSSTAYWAFLGSQSGRKPKDAAEIYGQFDWSATIIISNASAKLPLKILGQEQPSISTTSQSFIEWTQGLSPTHVVDRFVKSIQQSLPDLDFLAVSWYPTWTSWKDIDPLLRSSETASQIHGLGSAFFRWGDFVEQTTCLSAIEKLPPEVIERAIFDWVCHYHHLHPETCRASGVRLIFGVWHHFTDAEKGLDSSIIAGTCIGLVNQNALDHARSGGQELLTIALPDHPHQPYYEAVRVPDSLRLEYVIIGIWLRLKREYQVAEVGAELVNAEDDHNAYVI